MVWPFENVPTIWFWLSTATDCSWPAAKPFCCSWLTCAVPLELANWVRPLVPKFSCTLPSVSPFTVRFCSVTLGDRRSHFAVRIESERRADVLPGGLVPVALELL